MADKKIKKQSELEVDDTPFSSEFLEKVPIGFRSMVKTETDSIGELYRRAKFSVSDRHQSNQYMNAPAFKPISNFVLDSRFKEDEL